MTEIERKYLVKNNSYKVQAQKAGLIIQGYLGDEVTEDTRYYNYNLASNPYLNWDDDSE